jgi:hypothetical protein
MNLPQNVPALERTCPHLGLSHDPYSLMDYPCGQNFCYHVTPPSSPGEAHQKKFCLDPAHKTCPLFENALSKPMPKDISHIHHRRWFHFNFFPWILGCTFLLITGLFYYYWPLIGPNLIVPTLVSTAEKPSIAAIIPVTGSTSEVEPTSTHIVIAPDTPAPSDTVILETIVAPNVTATIIPIETELSLATLQPPHALETPFGKENVYLIHRVLGGETLDWIAKNHKTSVEAIRAANYDMTASLWEDSKIIIPVDRTDAAGIIPMTAMIITGDSISMETLAEVEQANLMLLCQLNDRPHSYIFSPGEWVLIPHPVTPTAH